jgi:hypothetical protein
MSPSIMVCPATCELCGQWMPGHSVRSSIYIICSIIHLLTLTLLIYRRIVLVVVFILASGHLILVRMMITIQWFHQKIAKKSLCFHAIIIGQYHQQHEAIWLFLMMIIK